MFSTAIIIFREVIEIALIIGIVLAATRGLPNRMKWIIGGFAGGLSGAGLVAIFAGVISSAAQGMGQELFNALILFTAAIVIGWTVLWMKGHAREMSMHFRQVGHDVRDGNLPFYSLSLIIGLAMLREGSEIVLFIYGMLLSGQSYASIASGSATGLTGGIVTGVLFYHGILKLPARYVLTVTSWLLIILVAGLTAQGIGYLTAAGYFSNYSQQLWDTSNMLSESSIIGKALHSLIGYTSHPTLAQLVAYLGVLVSLLLGAAFIEKKNAASKVVAAALAIFFIFPHSASALDKIHKPYVNKGELEIEYSGSRTSDGGKEKNNIQGHELAVAYGLTDYYQAELSTGYDRESGSPVKLEEVELENKFQFAEPGEMWMDSGLLVSYIHATHKHEPDAIAAKLLLQKDFGKFSSLANIGLEQEIGDNRKIGGPDMSLIWNNRYRYNEHFQPGIELQSNFGQTNTNTAFHDQEHYIGPSAFGRITNGFKYEAAYLVGVTKASPDTAARILLEYEIYFD